MKQKFFLFILAFCLSFIFFAKDSRAACWHCSGYYCVNSGTFDCGSCSKDSDCYKDCPAYRTCDAGACITNSGYRTTPSATCKTSTCSTSANCYTPSNTPAPTAVPTPCLKTCSYKYCSGSSCLSGGSTILCSQTCPASTCTDNASCSCSPGCWDCATGCCNSPDCYGGSSCKTCPTSAPVPTLVPTITPGGPTPACDLSNNNFCNVPFPDCYYSCLPCAATDIGLHVVRQKTTQCYDTCSPLANKCYDSTPLTYDAPLQCGYCDDIAYPTGCQPYTCYPAPDPVCPGFYPATTCTSSGGIGNCDNCGGMDCGYCPGVGVLPTPTPLPGGVTVSCNCSDYFSTALTVCDSTTFLCPGSNPAIYCYGLAGCNIPILGNVVIDNADSVAVTADASNRNHICEDTFVGASLPRRVIVEANVSDGDGYADISTVQLRWNGTIYNMSFVSGSINSATYRAVIDFSGAQNSGGTYAWEFNMVDADGNTSGWEDSIRSFKAWDCLVPVSGILYDGSAGQACNNTGFTTIIINATGFREMLYSNSLGVNDVAFVVSPPANYGSASLTWGQTYLPLINGGDVSNLNGDLTATGRFTRIIDEGVGTTSCPVNSQFNIGTYVSAYGLTPRAKVDMSFIRDQEAWFQVGGAGVKAKMDIDSGVPATMLPLSSRALSVSGINANNGLISYGGNFSNINGFNDSSAYGSPNNWYVNVNTNNLSNYSYQYFYNTFYVNGGIGVTGTSWNDHPSEGVYFVNGDMIVNSDFALASGKTLIVIVRGKISIGSNVNQVDGIFIADGNSSDSVGIEVGGTSDTQLLINGSLYSRKAIRLYRSFTDKIVNNTVPAVVIKYNPNLLFNMPGSLMRVLSGWREE